MRLGHINLNKELRGGEVQTLGLVWALAPHYSQRLIERRVGRLHRRLEAQPVAGVDVVPVANSIFAATAAATDPERVAELNERLRGRFIAGHVGALARYRHGRAQLCGDLQPRARQLASNPLKSPSPE